MDKKEITLEEMKKKVRIAKDSQVGGVAILANVTGVSTTYIYNMLRHSEESVSNKVANHFGYERVETVTYRPIKR